MWRIFKGILIFLVFLGIILVRTLSMDLLILDTIQIDESEHISEDYFVETTEIITHQNILRYQLEEKEKLIQAHPYVKQVSIQRIFPNTLEIKLKEREEYAIIPYNSTYLFVDRDLVLLRSANFYFQGEAPVLREVEVLELNEGDPLITSNDDLVKFFFDAHEALSVSELSSIIEGYYLREDHLIIETSEFIDIVFAKDIDLPYVVVATAEVFDDLMSRSQRNVSIVSKYNNYIYVKLGTYRNNEGSNFEDNDSSRENLETEEELTRDD